MNFDLRKLEQKQILDLRTQRLIRWDITVPGLPVRWADGPVPTVFELIGSGVEEPTYVICSDLPVRGLCISLQSVVDPPRAASSTPRPPTSSSSATTATRSISRGTSRSCSARCFSRCTSTAS